MLETLFYNIILVGVWAVIAVVAFFPAIVMLYVATKLLSRAYYESKIWYISELATQQKSQLNLMKTILEESEKKGDSTHGKIKLN